MSETTLPAVLSATELPAVEMPKNLQSFGGGYFESVEMFEAGQRMAKMFASADILPETFKGKMGNCLIALDMAHRLKANPIAVMQNIYMVHNRPAWSSQFLIACINKSGLFKTPLRYRFEGTEGKDDYGCVAWTIDHSGEKLESTKITFGMAKAEGWTTKNGSKWKTMPEQMLRYRAATFFARAYCPELTIGMMTNDEVRDTFDGTSEPLTNVRDLPGYIPGKSAAAAKLDAMLGLTNTEPPMQSEETIDVEPAPAKQPTWEEELDAFPDE
jgi:hypothetical protein